ncbi:MULTISPECIES: SAM-dependent methyltransferase [unclassified Bradyrhizobium]|uniref:class I SAM-dependent methyltransferase n=1 Tax=unclassified Bradyrhizobium TaxID=2631580 RepID=UPI0029164A88|nr:MULTISPECIES: SAM-dependent methyltransferase [unclassified Bradyrhizobium]
MQMGQPSRTALGAAILRAAHQTVDGASIFADPLARVLLGDDADTLIAAAAADETKQHLRRFIAARSRFAEDALATAVARGVRQAVIIGAGLDTFALRNPHEAGGLRVFEADHPATQAWKRERIAAAGRALPASLTFVPVDFEQQHLGDALAAAGFRPDEPAFFHWLGVVPYLRREAILAVLKVMVIAPGAEVVFDYTEPLDNYVPARRANVAALAARTAAIGEPWLSYFDPSDIANELRTCGFDITEDFSLADITGRFLGAPHGDRAREAGPHVMHARRLA